MRGRRLAIATQKVVSINQSGSMRMLCGESWCTVCLQIVIVCNSEVEGIDDANAHTTIESSLPLQADRLQCSETRDTGYPY